MEEIKVGANTSGKGSSVIKPLESGKRSKTPMNFTTKSIAIGLVLVVLGVATGYGVYSYRSAGTVRMAGRDVAVVKTASEEGVRDAATFKDTTTGELKENDGKITDEGTHILIRGDVSQNVYLTSSVVDLSKYVGKKVQVWGETFQGRKAGWLLDVGRIKVL